MDLARQRVATAMGGSDKELFFTSGASEGNRWLVDAATATKPFKTWVSKLEHPSLAKPLAAAFATGELIPVLDPAEAELIFATAAHNETGLITDWDSLITQASPDAILVADISQSLGRLAPLPTRIDAMVASAHKIGAYPGSGVVLLRGNARKLKAPWTGGGQEGNLRPGTEALNLIHAFGAAAAEIDSMRLAHRALEPLRDKLEAALLQAFPSSKRVPASGPRLPNTTAICFPGTNPDALRIQIDSVGLCVGFGSACSSMTPEPSPGLLALGLTPAEAKSTVRFSLCPETTEEMVDDAIKRLGSLGL